MSAGEELGEQLVSLFGGVALEARRLEQVGDLLIDGAGWLNDLDTDELKVVLKALELGATLVVLHPDHPQAADVVTYLGSMDTAARPVLALAVPSAPPPPTVLLIDPTSTVLDDHKVTGAACPECGAVNDGALEASNPGGGGPKPGDLGICAYCAAPAFYTDTMALRSPTSVELAELDADPQVTRIRDAVRLAILERKE